MKVKNILWVLITKILSHGVGLGVSDQCDSTRTILVKGALLWSTVDVRVVKQKRNYYECVITAIRSYGDRMKLVTPVCKHSLQAISDSTVEPTRSWCGGCKRQQVDYDDQLLRKQQIVQDCFVWLQDHHPVVLDCIASPQQYGYRNKIEFSFGKYIQAAKTDPVVDSIQAHWLLWFHKQWHYEKVIDIDQCHLIHPSMHEIFVVLRELCITSGLPVHDIKTHLGFWRHLVIRHGVHTDALMVMLAVSDRHFDDVPSDRSKWDIFLDLINHHPILTSRVTSMYVLYNNGIADIVRWQDCHLELLRGESYLYEQLHISLAFTVLQTQRRISPFAFFQTNTLGAEQLFSRAIALLPQITGNIIDLYCGSGTIGLSLLAGGIGQQLIGIELVEQATEDAYHNAALNHLTDRVQFHAGKVEKLLIQGVVSSDFLIGNDLIVVDPPREWLHGDVIKVLLELRATHAYTLLYISCNPVTLARDVWLLLQHNSRQMSPIQPVDMFPHTHHIESIVVLQ